MTSPMVPIAILTGTEIWPTRSTRMPAITVTAAILPLVPALSHALLGLRVMSIKGIIFLWKFFAMYLTIT